MNIVGRSYMSITSKRVETFKGRLWHQIFSINTCTSGTFRHQIFSDRFFMSEAVSYKCTAYDLYKIIFSKFLH